MAAGFLILRLLVFWLSSDVACSYVWPRANSGYGNRRPLHYARTLRQPNANLQPFGHMRTWQKPRFITGLGQNQMHKQMSPRGPQMFSTQTTQQRSYFTPQRRDPVAQPKGFQISLDIPFVNPDNQNTDSVEGYDYRNYITESRKRPSTVKNVQSGFETSRFVDPGNKYSAKYPYEETTNQVPISTIEFNFTIPLSVTSFNPLKSNDGHVESPTKPLNMFVPNRYKEPDMEKLGWRQTEPKWPAFNHIPQEPTQQQSGLKWAGFNQVAQEPTQQTGQKWPDYNQVAQEPTQQTGSQWPNYNQVAQEPTQQQTGLKWPNYNQVAQEPTQQQTGLKWADFNQVAQKPTQQQTGLKWADFNQVAQDPTQQQTGLKWPDYNQVAQEPTQQQTGLKWPDYNQVAQEPTPQQTGLKWPDYNQVAQEPTPQQTGLKWPDYNQVAQEPTPQQTGLKWPDYNQATQEPTQQTGSRWPDYNQATQEPTQQTGSQWPDYNQATQEPTQQTGQQLPDYQPVTQEPAQQTGQQLPDYQPVTQEPAQQQMELTWSDYNQVEPEPSQQQTTSKWSLFNQVDPVPQTQQTYEPVYEGPKKPTFLSWQLSQHSSPQQVGNKYSPENMSWGLQRPGATKHASPPTVQYHDNLDVHGPQMSPSKKYKELILQPDITKLHLLSPLHFNRFLSGGSDSDDGIGADPSKYQSMGKYRAPSTKDLTEQPRKESTHEISIPNIKLGFTIPLLSQLSNVTQSNSGYSVNIKPENTVYFTQESTKSQSKSPQTAMKWPILTFEQTKNQKPQEQAEKKWPLINLDSVFQQAKQLNEPVYSRPTDGKLTISSWNPSRTVNQDKTVTRQSWGVQKAESNEPRSPIHSISKYLQLSDSRRPLKDDQMVQPKPTWSETAKTLQYPWLKPSGSTYARGQSKHSGSSPLAFASKLDNFFKPSTVHQERVETKHSSPLYPQGGYDRSFQSPRLNAAPASTKPQRWQKESSSDFFQYNSGQKASETSQTPHFLSTRYQPEKRIPGQDFEHNQDKKGKYGKLFIDSDRDGFLHRQHSVQTQMTQKYPGKSPSCDSSSSSREQASVTNRIDSLYPHKKPQSGVGRCPNKPENYEPSYNVPVNYSPSAQATSVSVPSNAFQPVLSGSISHPVPSVFHLKQYNVGQNHQSLRSN